MSAPNGGICPNCKGKDTATGEGTPTLVWERYIDETTKKELWKCTQCGYEVSQ